MSTEKENNVASKKNKEGEKSPSKTSKTKTPKRKTSPEEQAQFDALYAYVRDVILEYDETMILSSYQVKRLKGMAQGSFLAKDREKTNLTYGYSVVLETFRMKKSIIHYVLKNNQFNNEDHKVNFIFKMIESSINDVYLKQIEEEKRYQSLIGRANEIHDGIQKRLVSETNKKKVQYSKERDEKYKDMW